MPAPKKFLVRERSNGGGTTTFYARFTDQNGTRQEFKLGRSPEWNADRAAREVAHIRADVERNTWSPHPNGGPSPQAIPFNKMAHEWWEKKIVEKKALATQAAYQAVVVKHLEPYFEAQPISTITPKDIDDFSSQEVSRGLKTSYINSHIRILGAILDTAMDWYEGVLPRNPARGQARYLSDEKVQDPDRWLNADQVELLLRAARHRDATSPRADYRRIGRESLIACLCFSGLRSSELCALTWHDVDCEQRILYGPGTKTDAAAREINIVDGLLPHLDRRRSETPYPEKHHLVWPTANGEPRDKDNLNRRVVQPVVEQARAFIAEDRKRSEQGDARQLDVLLPERLTPHTFRRTFCGFATEVEKDPFYVQAQMGHANPAFTQRLYNRVRTRASDPDPRVRQWLARPQRPGR